MTRIEMIECLEQLRLEEACFKRRNENRALRAAIRIMKYDRIKRTITVLVVVIAIILSFCIGVDLGAGL